MRQREEVLNICFAQVLCGIGLDAAPETIQHGNKLPDVLIQYQGMRIIIEGKYEDAKKAKAVVTRQAQERIDLGLAQISAAMIYPKHLKVAPFEQLKKELAKTTYSFCVFSEVGQSQWRQGGIGDVRQEISRVHESMCKEDAVQRAAKNLSSCLDGVANLFQGQEEICEQIASALGIGKPSGHAKKTIKEKFFRNHGIPVYVDGKEAIQHNKVMIIDSEIVITGSFNFTKAAEERNAENVLVIRSKEMAKMYLENWNKHKEHSG